MKNIVLFSVLGFLLVKVYSTLARGVFITKSAAGFEMGLLQKILVFGLSLYLSYCFLYNCHDFVLGYHYVALPKYGYGGYVDNRKWAVGICLFFLITSFFAIDLITWSPIFSTIKQLGHLAGILRYAFWGPYAVILELPFYLFFPIFIMYEFKDNMSY